MSQQNKHIGINITSVLTHGQSEWAKPYQCHQLTDPIPGKYG